MAYVPDSWSVADQRCYGAVLPQPGLGHDNEPKSRISIDMLPWLNVVVLFCWFSLLNLHSLQNLRSLFSLNIFLVPQLLNWFSIPFPNLNALSRVGLISVWEGASISKTDEESPRISLFGTLALYFCHFPFSDHCLQEITPNFCFVLF